MRNHFEEQLTLLHVELIKMGALCEEAISAAAKAMETGDGALLEQASAAEQNIDRMEREIEALCMRLLLRQQPVACDLRTISSALKMISDMERIGDQAADIADIIRHSTLNGCPEPLLQMARAAITMVTDSVDAYVNADLNMAQRVMQADDRLDELFLTVRNDLITAILLGSSSAEELVDRLMIAKYLERIGDHAVNIAEWVVYSVTGRHPNEPTELKE